jgi:tRNA (guanine-N7-)-methyltransferase
MVYFRAMGKDKLKRFAENESFEHMIQPTREEAASGLDLRGNWGWAHFKNHHPIVLELGCGHGDYAVGLARLFPTKNFVGVDIKGARMWKGAKTALNEGLANVAFLRTEIELIDKCFAKNEVNEIWITFPDPQMKHRRAKHRLVHPGFLQRYKNILQPDGMIHLKSDSEFLHGYLSGILHESDWKIHEAYYDIHHQLKNEPNHLLFTLQTHYEQKWLNEGKAITYLRFSPN